jgi:anti-sigma-K factor RskA
VLGVLSSNDRRRVEARMMADPGFAAKVQRWEGDFSSFNEAYQDEKVPDRVYSDLEARLFAGQGTPEGSVAGRLWRSLALWRSVAVAASAAALILVILHLDIGNIGPRDTPLLAELTGTKSAVNLIAAYDRQSGVLRVTPVASKAEGRKSLELWLIDGNKPPKPLGVLPDNGDGKIIVPDALRQNFTEGQIIAVSIEPPGGSPTGLPTGPVIALGKITAS